MSSGHLFAPKPRERWTWYGFDRQRRHIVALVNGRRTDRNCQRLYEQLQSCRVTCFHTDDWQSYSKVLPARRHEVSKEGARRIERQNLNFRTHVKRLHRRTICFSKSVEMHDAVLKLYVQHSNLRQHQI
jgi:insertion element IS1 protein InsB